MGIIFSEDESSSIKVGLLPAALEVIKTKAAENNAENKPTICSLLIGDLSLNLKPQMYKVSTPRTFN